MFMIKNNIKTFVLLSVFAIFSLCLTLDVQAKDYVCQKLKSGQTVIVKKVSDNHIVTINTWIKTGSINEDDKNSGVAHFLEHLFFKGTQKNPTGTFDRILESKGANTNAATSKDFTHYYITIPSKDFDLALSLHSDMLLNPLIPRKELEKERLVVLEEISKGKDSPTNVMWENLFSLIYGSKEPKHPYFRPVIGKKEVIETITREEILDFYNKFYTPSNMATVIVGDVDPDDALKKVEQYFTPQGELRIANEVVYPKIKPLDSILRVSDEMDVNQAYAVIAFKAPKFKDDKDTYALDVLAAILGDSKSSKLNQMLKEQKHLVYSISASNSSFMDDGLFTISATLDEKNLKEVEGEILEEIKKVQNGEVSQAEVNKAKNMIKTDTYYSRESVSNISDELGYLTTFWGSCAYYDNYLNNIEKVTRSDVIRVAKKYLTTSKYAISTVTPKSNNLKEIAQIAAAAKVQTEAKILEKTPNATKYLLDNGAILIIKKSKSNSIIAIDIEAKGSKILEKIPSTGMLAASVAKQGTKKYSNSEFANLLDEKGIKLSLSSGSDTFSIAMQTTKDELNSALEVLDEVVNNPVFSSSETEKIKNLRTADLKKIQDNALSIGLDEFKKIAFEGSYYGQSSKYLLEKIPSVTPDDIKSYYQSVLNPENIVITIVGDVSEKDIISKISPIFKAKKGKKINFKEETINVFTPQKNIDSVVIKPDTQTAWVFVGYKTCSVFNEKDMATLKVINAILGEGMSSRLFQNLRDEKGLAYVVGSTVFQNILDGSFVAYIGTNNNSIDIAKQGMINEINILKKEYVTQKELQEAKDKIMGNILISLETNMDDASLLGYYAISERGIDYLERYKKLINEVSQSDILEVANKYFSKPYISVVVKADSSMVK